MSDGTVSYEQVRAAANLRIRTLLEAFEFKHLPPELQAISKPFADLAHLHAATVGAAVSSEATVHLEHGLNDLLKAKDAIVRAYVTSPVPVTARPS